MQNIIIKLLLFLQKEEEDVLKSLIRRERIYT